MGRLRKSTKLSDYTVKRLVDCFADDLATAETEARVRVSRRTITDWYGHFRILLRAKTDFLSFYLLPPDYERYQRFREQRLAKLRVFPPATRPYHESETFLRFITQPFTSTYVRNVLLEDMKEARRRGRTWGPARASITNRRCSGSGRTKDDHKASIEWRIHVAGEDMPEDAVSPTGTFGVYERWFATIDGE